MHSTIRNHSPLFETEILQHDLSSFNLLSLHLLFLSVYGDTLVKCYISYSIGQKIVFFYEIQMNFFPDLVLIIFLT